MTAPRTRGSRVCTIETAQAEVSAAVRAALAGDVPDLSPQQICRRLLTMMGSGQRNTDLDAAVGTLTEAVARALDDSDVARLVAHGHQCIHDEVSTIALCWGYDADAAKRLASNLVPTVLVTLGYLSQQPYGRRSVEYAQTPEPHLRSERGR